MNYTNLVQAIAQQPFTTTSKIKLKTPTLENKIIQMTDASNIQSPWNIWANQVSNNNQARFAVLVSSEQLKYVRNVFMVNNPVTKLPTCVSCSGDGIQIRQLIQFDPFLMTAITCSVATTADTAALNLKALNISLTDFKDHANSKLNASNNCLGFAEGVNMVVTPVM